MKDTINNTIKDTKKVILSIFDSPLKITADSILLLSAIQSLTPVTSNSFIVRGLFSLKLSFLCQIDFSRSAIFFMKRPIADARFEMTGVITPNTSVVIF